MSVDTQQHVPTGQLPVVVEHSRSGPAHSAGPERLVTPTFVVAWVVNFLQYLTFYMLVTTMALYAVKSFAASDAVGGFASSAFVVGATLARLVSGYLVDALGRRRMLLIALVVVAVACALYIPAGSLPVLIAVRMVHGFGYAFASTAVMTIAQSVIPDSRRGEGTGYFALGTTLATAIGPALGLFLWAIWTTRGCSGPRWPPRCSAWCWASSCASLWPTRRRRRSAPSSR